MDNLWTRRTNSGKLSLSTSHGAQKDSSSRTDSPRYLPTPKRIGADPLSHGKHNALNALTPGGASSTASPTIGGSSAFGLGTGAFASFGSSSKPPKTVNSTLDSQNVSSAIEKKAKEQDASLRSKSASSASSGSSLTGKHLLKSTWVVWYRPPTSKYSDYEKSTIALASFSTVESFWGVYKHLKRPSALPSVSDYHIFKKGIRPVWEDEENKRGGKWIVRLKKGVADRYWEDLLLAMLGDQFAEAGEEVCGAVLSVRSGEDVLSIWTRNNGGRNIKIRETVKRLLAFPSDTNIQWKSHDDSIAQRSALDQARQDKNGGQGGHSGKRRDTLLEDNAPEKIRV